MGDPKKSKKKYSGPSHPWQASRIEEEKKLIKDYGLKNKSEIWKAVSMIDKFKNKAKEIIASSSVQGKVEEKQLLARLEKLNLLSKGSKIEDVLNLNVNSLLDRRLQTIVFKKNFARTPKQARQFVVHGHVGINNVKIDVPSCIVPFGEEGHVEFLVKSKFKKEDHPERLKKEVSVKEKKEPLLKKDVREKKVEKKVKAEVKEKKVKKEKGEKKK